MADENEETVEVELLADGIRVEGRDYKKGDVVTLPKGFAENLAKFGSVGKKGTLEARAKAEADLAEAEARRQNTLQGLDISEPYVADGADKREPEKKEPEEKKDLEAPVARGRR